MKTINTKSGRMPVTSPILKFLVWAFLVAVILCIAGGVFGENIPSGATKVLKTAAKVEQAHYLATNDQDTVFGQWYGSNHLSWCATFISWVFNEAHLSKLVSAQSSKGFATCSVGLEWFTKKGQIVPVEQARPGDIVFYLIGESPRSANHVGLLLENHPDKSHPKKSYVVCYEGNTSDPAKGPKSSERGVFKKTRNYGLVVGVARPRYE